MGILSEIFAELTEAFEEVKTEFSSLSKDDSYEMADPFKKKEMKVETANETIKSVPKNAPISQQKTELEMHSHKHPAKNHSKTEMRPQYVGSLGKVEDEGCSEHGDERYISQRRRKVTSSSITVSDMRHAVIMSEILGSPKAKRK